MTMLRTGVLALVLVGSIASHARAASPGEEGFRRLGGKQIRQAFVSRIFSDEVHFADRYLADGKIESESMGTKKTYSWRIDEDRLCISDSQSDVCYFVWAKSNAIRLLPDGPGIPGDGYIR
jgi:hypothetical protein